jgi:two-component system alkaline phosphatase synthesis response regulator PhoP
VQKLLLVEDEKNIAESLLFNLEGEFDVTWAATGEDALAKWKSGAYDLVILDVMLPKLSGYEVCETIRKTDVRTPILFLTAKNRPLDRVEGLKLGGDDYLGKPFNLDEFLLRVRGLLRRTAPPREPVEEAVYRFGQNAVDFQNYEAVARGVKIQLTKKECLLMKLLIENEGRVVTRETILTKVWGYETLPSTRTVDNFVVKLRGYFEPDARDPKYIHSIRGVGYKFTNIPD